MTGDVREALVRLQCLVINTLFWILLSLLRLNAQLIFGETNRAPCMVDMDSAEIITVLIIGRLVTCFVEDPLMAKALLLRIQLSIIFTIPSVIINSLAY